MYIKEKILKGLKIMSVIIAVVMVLDLAVGVYYMGDMLLTYGLDVETITKAAGYDASIRSFIFAPIILCALKVMNNGIKEAYFYNSYFEGDLSGVISFQDLSNITGDSEEKVRRKVKIYRKVFMNNYEIHCDKNEGQIVLNSKKIRCRCRGCGAEIDKSEIFVSNCPYCGSLDVAVEILSSSRFYTISYDNEKKKSLKDFLCKNHVLKITMYVTCCAIFATTILILLFIGIDYLQNINNQEYLQNVLMKGIPGLGSYELIKNSMRSQLIFNSLFIAVFLIAVLICVIRLELLSVAHDCAVVFEKAMTPFLKASNIFKKRRNKKNNREKQMKKVKKAIGFSYLKNCSFEKYNGKLYVTLGRKVVRDKCPNCGAPIKDPVYENYECKYCGSKIMGVVAKK